MSSFCPDLCFKPSGNNIIIPMPISIKYPYERQSSWISGFLRSIIFYGQAIFVIPFSITKSKDGEYYESRSGLLRKGIYFSVQFFLMAAIIYRFFQIRGMDDDITIMKSIWRIAFFLFISYDIVVYYFCGWRAEAWLGVFRQGIRVEYQFNDLGINIRHFWDNIWSIGISVMCFLMGLVHVLALRNISKYDGTKLNDDDDIKLIPFTARSVESLELQSEVYDWILSTLIAIPDVITWGIWHYGDAVAMTGALAAGKLYQCLNDYLNQANLAEIKRNFNKIVLLHQSITELVHNFNNLLTWIIFVALIHNISYICYYANFTLFGFGGILRRICFTSFSVRSALGLWFKADVNTKAHRITRTLGKLSADPGVFPQHDPNKFAIFTSQIYHEHIGFKGLQFFTVTTSFIGKIIGVLISYTVILIQFAKE